MSGILHATTWEGRQARDRLKTGPILRPYSIRVRTLLTTLYRPSPPGLDLGPHVETARHSSRCNVRYRQGSFCSLFIQSLIAFNL